MRNPGNGDEQDVQEPESEREEDKDGRVGLEERNNGSCTRCELEYVMEDEIDEQHTGEDDGGDRNSDSELDSE